MHTKWRNPCKVRTWCCYIQKMSSVVFMHLEAVGCNVGIHHNVVDSLLGFYHPSLLGFQTQKSVHLGHTFFVNEDSK